MEGKRVVRDVGKQADYKVCLEKESISVYGVKKCFASHKQYKGLIASHIKPYKLCVLENDIESQFNVDNGLLLAKHIDDYFDKLLITFDKDGTIICCDEIPDEIKEEFAHYKLDAIIYNDARKQYMQIHRSLFFYKHYYATTKLYVPTLDIDKINISYFDCGIKFYKKNFIIQNDDIWTICPSHKLKQEFIKRTQYKFKYFISNADLANILLRTEEYIVPDNNPIFLNFPSCSMDFSKKEMVNRQNSFVLSHTNFDPEIGTPDNFISLLYEAFNFNELAVLNFRKVLHFALLGERNDKAIILHGDFESIDAIMSIIRRLFGTYFYLHKEDKILRKQTHAGSIPNCLILYIENYSDRIDNRLLNQLVHGELFVDTPLNINPYTAFIKVGNLLRGELNNTIGFRFYKTATRSNLDELILSEGSKILYWILSQPKEEIEEIAAYDMLATSSIASIDKWLTKCCTMKKEMSIKTPAYLLYDSYYRYAKENNINPKTKRAFYIYISKSIPKKREGSGIYYLGVEINK